MAHKRYIQVAKSSLKPRRELQRKELKETLIELLVDITENNDGPIGKYIAKNGPGIQHMALRVDDIKAAIADLTEAGVRMIDKAPRNGAGQMKIAFIHPKSAGLLLELCQPAATYKD